MFSKNAKVYWREKERKVVQNAVCLEQIYLYKTAGTAKREAFLIYWIRPVLQNSMWSFEKSICTMDGHLWDYYLFGLRRVTTVCRNFNMQSLVKQVYGVEI